MMESDTYRTRDGKAHFSFNFIQKEDIYEVNVNYLPREIKSEAVRRFCQESSAYGYKIVLEQPPYDIYTARLMASDWAEIVWEELNTTLNLNKQNS